MPHSLPSIVLSPSFATARTSAHPSRCTLFGERVVSYGELLHAALRVAARHSAYAWPVTSHSLVVWTPHPMP